MFCTECGAEVVAEQNPPPTATTPMGKSELGQLDFYKIGEYELSGGEVVRKTEEGIGSSERLPLVYAITSGETVAYFGQTLQGYRRPLGYHKNQKMKTVRDGIRQSLLKEKTVEVFARSEGLALEREGLELNLREAIEKALTKKYRPAWNQAVDD